MFNLKSSGDDHVTNSLHQIPRRKVSKLRACGREFSKDMCWELRRVSQALWLGPSLEEVEASGREEHLQGGELARGTGAA